MHVFSLPQYFNVDTSAPLQLVDYRVDEASQKNKINLTQNTFSFLLEGTKEIIADGASTAHGEEEFLIIRSGRCLMTENVSAANRSYRSLLLFFSDEALLEFVEQHQLKGDSNAEQQHFHLCPAPIGGLPGR